MARRRTSLLAAAGAQPIQSNAVASQPVVEESTDQQSQAESTVESRTMPKQRSRAGRSAATTYISKEAKRQLLQLKLDTGLDVEDLLREGINMVFEKYNKNPIA